MKGNKDCIVAVLFSYNVLDGATFMSRRRHYGQDGHVMLCPRLLEAQMKQDRIEGKIWLN